MATRGASWRLIIKQPERRKNEKSCFFFLSSFLFIIEKASPVTCRVAVMFPGMMTGDFAAERSFLGLRFFKHKAANVQRAAPASGGDHYRDPVNREQTGPRGAFFQLKALRLTS